MKDFKTVTAELESLKDSRRKMCDEIKGRGLPVIIFGAGLMAEHVTKKLNELELDFDGYAVDEKYFKPGKTYLGKSVYNYDELLKQPDKVIFILGMDDEVHGGNRAVEFLQDERIIRYAFSDTNESINFEYIAAHTDEFAETFEMLADELSRKTMAAYLKTKITADPHYNFGVYDPDQYFNTLTIRQKRGGGYADCGAYRGDTLEKFIAWSGGNYEKIFGIEADPENFSALKKFVFSKGYRNVELFNCGVWNEKTKLTFDSTSNSNATISDSGNVTIDAEKLDDIIGNASVSLIKMDIEGSELPALRGAVKIIEKNKPALAICAYHKAEDLITIPQFIKEIHCDYKFYLRKHTRAMDNELVLYAVA